MVRLWECCDVPLWRAYGNSCGCTLPLESLRRHRRWFAAWGIFDFYNLRFNCLPVYRQIESSQKQFVSTRVRRRLCAAVIVPLSAWASSVQTCQFPESSFTFFFFFFFPPRSPFIFLRPVSFKETEVIEPRNLKIKVSCIYSHGTDQTLFSCIFFPVLYFLIRSSYVNVCAALSDATESGSKQPLTSSNFVPFCSYVLTMFLHSSAWMTAASWCWFHGTSRSTERRTGVKQRSAGKKRGREHHHLLSLILVPREGQMLAPAEQLSDVKHIHNYYGLLLYCRFVLFSRLCWVSRFISRFNLQASVCSLL